MRSVVALGEAQPDVTYEKVAAIPGKPGTRHGFQQGPVVGEHLAQLALDREPSFDLSQFAVERFATGAVRREQNVI
jgi:hypothetical protein